MTKRIDTLGPWLGVPVLLCGMILAGCDGGDGLARQAVSGTATLDGQPLAQGSIQFVTAADGDAPVMSGGSLIRDGRYEITEDQGLVPGTYRVSINATRGGGRSGAETPVDAGPVPQDMIPAKYNAKSTLAAEVKEGGSNQFDYDLTSK
jgi:hypothetical protein